MASISIILPVYNGEKYLENILSKILNQSFQDFELLIINDGSVDNSLKICQKFSEKDNRIVVIDQKNSGICKSRNAGIECATGKYLVFVDQDDDISLNMLKCFFESAETNNADMVIGSKIINYMYLFSNGSTKCKTQNYIYDNTTVCDKVEIFNMLTNVNNEMKLMHIWNCFYRKEIIIDNDIRFDEFFKYGHEDTMFNFEYSMACNRINMISDVVYYYYRRQGVSTSTKFNDKYYEDYAYFVMKIKNKRQIRGIEESISNNLFSFFFRFGLNVYYHYLLLGKLTFDDKKALLNSIFSNCKGFQVREPDFSKSVKSKLYCRFLYTLYYLLQNKRDNLAVRIIGLSRFK